MPLSRALRYVHARRRKAQSTTLWHGSAISLATLAHKCDGKHDHLPWSISTTSAERRYPDLFCQRYARIAKKKFLKDLLEKKKAEFTDKVFVETQPRRGMQEMIPEFKQVVTEIHCSVEEANSATKAMSDRKLKFSFRNHSIG